MSDLIFIYVCMLQILEFITNCEYYQFYFEV